MKFAFKCIIIMDKINALYIYVNKLINNFITITY